MRSPKITFYIITNDLNPNEILTITENKEQSREFYHKYLCTKHFHTFKPWCEARNLDYQDMNSWNKYYNENISSAEANTYKVSKVKFTKKELMSLLRALSGCQLYGCSFETDFDLHIRG